MRGRVKPAVVSIGEKRGTDTRTKRWLGGKAKIQKVKTFLAKIYEYSSSVVVSEY